MGISIFPKKTIIYDLLDQDIDNLCCGMTAFQTLLDAPPEERTALAQKVKEIEHQGDELTHRIFKELDKTFSLPMDAEDLHGLVGKLDGVLNYIEGAGLRFGLYDVGPATPQAREITAALAGAVEQVAQAIRYMRRHERLNAEILTCCRRINEYENDGDSVFRETIRAELDPSNYPLDNPRASIEQLLLAMKWREIYENIEHGLDKCEAVADDIETIVRKYA